jgi:hypothetical protein
MLEQEEVLSLTPPSLISIYPLLEVDVTDARQFIENPKARTAEALSFTDYLAFALRVLWMSGQSLLLIVGASHANQL